MKLVLTWLEYPVRPETPANADLQDPRGLRVVRVDVDPRVNPALMELAFQVQLVNVVNPETRGNLDPLVDLVGLVRRASVDPRVNMVKG